MDVDAPWAPFDVAGVVAEFSGCGAIWWISGGHALELATGRSWRDHGDIDVGIRRCDAPEVLGHLAGRGWEVAVAAAGVLRPWSGEHLDVSAAENNVWCRRPGGPWQLDVTVGEGDDTRWIYRRDPAIVRPWGEALGEASGVRYLEPHLQLLFKSRDPRPKDTIDAGEVIAELPPGGVALLDAQLRPDHPWASLLDAHRPECTATDAAAMVGLLDAAGIDAWVDGGWAVDALLGGPTRVHRDLDVAVTVDQLPAAVGVLDEAGFRIVREDGPANQVFADAGGRVIDVHAFDPDATSIGADGIARHAGRGLAYEVDGFDGAGVIAGRRVRCIDPATLVRYHTGYPVDADDWHDVEQLCSRFSLPIPADYDAFR